MVVLPRLTPFPLQFFYGGGPQKQRPATVAANMGMQPVERLELGRTSRSETEIEAFLRAEPIRTRFSAARYDLFLNNCNHFAHELVLWLGCERPVPDAIVSLPQRIRSTPLGASVFSMWSNLAGGGGMGGGDPLGGLFAGSGSSAEAVSVRTTAPSVASSTTATPAAAHPAPAAVSPSARLSAPPSLVFYEDAAGAPLVAQRLRKAAASISPAASASAGSGPPLSAVEPLSLEEQRLLDTLPERLRDAAPAPWAALACALAARACSGGGGWQLDAVAFPGALLARLLALRSDCVEALTTASSGGGASGALALLVEGLSEGGAGAWAHAGARNQALQALANAFRTPAGAAWGASPQVAPLLVGVACAELRSPRSDLRAIAGALALAVAGGVGGVAGDGAGGHAAQLLLGCLDACDTEPDAETAARRLLAGGLVLVHARAAGVGDDLAALARDVECTTPLRALRDDAARPPPLRALAAEVLQSLGA